MFVCSKFTKPFMDQLAFWYPGGGDGPPKHVRGIFKISFWTIESAGAPHWQGASNINKANVQLQKLKMIDQYQVKFLYLTKDIFDSIWWHLLTDLPGIDYKGYHGLALVSKTQKGDIEKVENLLQVSQYEDH